MQEFGGVDNFVLNVKTFRLIYLLETFLECMDMSESRLALPLVASVECFFFFFFAQIVKSESRADVWGIYAKWHKIKGNLTMCCEALLKQVRSYQVSPLLLSFYK